MTTTLTRPSDVAALTADSPLAAPPGTMTGLLTRIFEAYAPVAPVRR